MAKSLRAKSKVRNRGIKRATIFEPVVLARTARLSKKLTGSDVSPQNDAEASTASASEPADINRQEDDAAPMDVESTAAATISTSGWKGSRNEQWKQKKVSKIITKKKQGNKSLVFPSKKQKKSKK
ncbi:uncharacterized protein V1513DRAFT_453639 [Lipomyces chichibuensis]|uniref:uncharacterized protein n=1 Tax=Lipomyces chichibuensis TaxID=1546026 RepID=UPI0033441CE6